MDQPDDGAKRAHEATRRAQERMREASKDAVRVTEQMTAAGAETLSVWGSVNQAVLNDFMELGAKTAEESMRTGIQMQRMMLDMFRDSQQAVVRWQSAWPEAFRDPIRWYQRTLEESFASTQRALDLSRRAAETYAQSLERAQASAGETVGAVGERFKEAVSKMQDVTSRIDRLRAA